MSNYHTRPAEQNDVFAMEQIMRDAFEASYAKFMPEQYIREWYDNDQAALTVRKRLNKAGVVELMGRIVGFVCLDDNSISELWVDPKHQGQGAGRALIQWADSALASKGFPTMTLYCYAENTDAFEFYKKLRFRKASEFMSRDVPGGPVKIYNMVKVVKRLKK